MEQKLTLIPILGGTLRKGTVRTGNQKNIRHDQDCSFVENVSNTQAIPGNLTRVAVTQTLVFHSNRYWCKILIRDEKNNDNKYFRRTRKLSETKLYCRNLIRGINTKAITLVKYSEPFLKWKKEYLLRMDGRTRKRMTLHKVLYSRDDVDRLNVPRKVGEEAFKHRRERRRERRYIDKTTRRLHKKEERLKKTNNIRINKTRVNKKKCEEKQLYRYFK